MNQKTADNFYITKFRTARFGFWFIITLTISVPFIAASLSEFKPDKISDPEWFARSGSIMVVFAMLAESKVLEMLNLFRPVGFVETGFTEFREKYYRKASFYNSLAFILMGTGTVIWGYGDIIFTWSNKITLAIS